MDRNYYMINMQQLLFMTQELHHRGYENLRVIPYLSNTGLAWRCSFISTLDKAGERINASSWIQDVLKITEPAEESVKDLVELFERGHLSFLKKCEGKNAQYVEWFGQMLRGLAPDELPYAFADYFGPTDYWKTSSGQKIPTLPNEEHYYF